VTGEYLNQAINAQTPWSMKGEGRYWGSQFSKPESNEFQLIIIMTQKNTETGRIRSELLVDPFSTNS